MILFRRKSERKKEEYPFLIPKNVSWTVNDIYSLEASGDYTEALKRWKILLAPFQDPKLAPRIAKLKTPAYIWLQIGLCYRHLERYEEALEAYRKAEVLARDKGDSSILAEVYNCISVVYRHQGKIDKALNQLSKVLREAKSLGDSQTLAAAYDNIANCHRQLGQFDQALDSERNAYKLVSKIDPSVQSRILGNLGVFYIELGQTKEGVSFLKKGLKKARKAGDRAQESLILENLSKLVG